MKWSIHELRKHHRTENSFEYDMDCHDFLEPGTDLVDVSLAHVRGENYWDEQEDMYVFMLNINCHLTMLCAITLKEVDVPLAFDTKLEFAHRPIDDNTILIEGETIDLDPYVWAEILIEKPMKVLSKHAYDHYVEDIVELEEEEKLEDNPFAKLKEKQA